MQDDPPDEMYRSHEDPSSQGSDSQLGITVDKGLRKGHGAVEVSPSYAHHPVREAHGYLHSHMASVRERDLVQGEERHLEEASKKKHVESEPGLLGCLPQPHNHSRLAWPSRQRPAIHVQPPALTHSQDHTPEHNPKSDLLTVEYQQTYPTSALLSSSIPYLSHKHSYYSHLTLTQDTQDNSYPGYKAQGAYMASGIPNEQQAYLADGNYATTTRSSTSPPPVAHRRGYQACDACRKRKVRCDLGSMPLP